MTDALSASSWVPLSRRGGGAPPEDLVDGMPDWLYAQVSGWLFRALQLTDGPVVVLRPGHGLTADTRRVMTRVRITTQPWLLPADDPMFLDAVDAAVRWTEWKSEARLLQSAIGGVDDPGTLEGILAAANSVWRATAHGLERRQDPTVTASAMTTADRTPGAAGDHLAAAWSAAYGRNADPDKVFNEAVRAVETLACPLVEQRKAEAGKATLGTVIGELRNNSGHKWELALPGLDGSPREVEPLVGMLELLWQAQVSRHGGAPKSRRQDQAEAAAAVHLAAVLVQWLSTGVLRKKP